jgi:uncharacterized protein YutE (UPF0331/DUF86 family)
MTFLATRLGLLRLHLAHLRTLETRVSDARALANDLSLQNDVVHSLFMVAQLVIDISGELSARAGLAFEGYREAIENLRLIGYADDLVAELAPLAGFRNAVVHGYLMLDRDRVVAALRRLDPVERFVQLVAERENRLGQAE